MSTQLDTDTPATETATRDLTAFRRLYDLPTQHDYMAMLTSPDHQRLSADLTGREQAAVARLRAEGFNGSTLGEAYEWWRQGADAADGCDDEGSGASGCGGACHCH